MTGGADSPGAPGTTAMRREIAEIPAAVERLVRHAAGSFETVGAAVQRRAYRFAVIAARGTSDHAAIYCQYLLEAWLGIPVALATASLTTVYRRPQDWSQTLFVGLSQSGAAPDVVAVAEAARRGGATTISITNDEGSLLARATEFSLPCAAGPELAVAATKTYVAELAAVARLVAALSGDATLALALARAPEELARVIGAADGWLAAEGDGLVESLARAHDAIVISRGFNLPTALEIALKLQEAAAIFALGFSSADFMHGPITLARTGVPVLAFRPDGPMGESIDGTVEAIGRADADLWLVGNRDGSRPGVPSGQHLALGFDLPESLTPLAFVIPGFVLVEAVARRKGLNPDAPPRLTKVTKTL